MRRESGEVLRIPRSSYCPGTDTPHHWIIEPPDGPRSKADCKHCGSSDSFLNSNLEEFKAWRDRENKLGKNVSYLPGRGRLSGNLLPRDDFPDPEDEGGD